jgi:N-acetylglucosamine kinase-like BadF-type ATPase
MCVLAVDGGNSKTIALVASLDGKILGTGRGGNSDVYQAQKYAGSPQAAVDNVEYAVMDALKAAQARKSDVLAAVFSMAGADWPEDYAYLQASMEERGLGRTILVQNDAMSVLYDGTADTTGVSVVCGTGAATGARGPDGRIWASSRWQDQAGGGAHLGLIALDGVYRSEIGIEQPTSLTPRFLNFFGVDRVEDILYLSTSRLKCTTKSVALLAPILLDEAQAGDSVARKIVLEHGRMLGNYALAAARIVGIEGTPFRLILSGGVFRHPSPLLPGTIIEHVRTSSPAVRPMRYSYEPIIGVLFAALEAAGVTIDATVLSNVLTTMPPATLFATVDTE